MCQETQTSRDIVGLSMLTTPQMYPNKYDPVLKPNVTQWQAQSRLALTVCSSEGGLHWGCCYLHYVWHNSIKNMSSWRMSWPRHPSRTAERTADEKSGKISTPQTLQQLSDWLPPPPALSHDTEQVKRSERKEKRTKGLKREEEAGVMMRNRMFTKREIDTNGVDKRWEDIFF